MQKLRETNQAGTSMLWLSDAAEALGFITIAIKIHLEPLGKSRHKP